MSAEAYVGERGGPRFRGLPLGVYFLTGFAIIGIGLFAGFEMTVGRRIERRIVEARVVQIRNIGNVTAHVISQYLDERRRSIEQAARFFGLKGGTTDAEIATALAEAHRLHPHFLTMLVAGPGGDVLAVSPPSDARRGTYVPRSHNVADRDYFRVTLQQGSTFVSGVFRGRGLGTDPIIAVATPIPLADGTGIIEGSLDLDILGEIIRAYRTFAGVQSMIVDPKGQVVYASSRSVPILTPIASTDLAIAGGGVAGRGPLTLYGSRDII
ncbi:MAG TPA: cache domain-containing protein, partial [Thermoanaerobaculia bacterium]|nr:cache domain-containing protein [Thermoanaerobaculia bacterium]